MVPLQDNIFGLVVKIQHSVILAGSEISKSSEVLSELFLSVKISKFLVLTTFSSDIPLEGKAEKRTSYAGSQNSLHSPPPHHCDDLQ